MFLLFGFNLFSLKILISLEVCQSWKGKWRKSIIKIDKVKYSKVKFILHSDGNKMNAYGKRSKMLKFTGTCGYEWKRVRQAEKLPIFHNWTFFFIFIIQQFCHVWNSWFFISVCMSFNILKSSTFPHSMDNLP